MRVRFSFVSSVLIALYLIAPAAFSTTIHVPADQPTIQAGIDAAVNGDTVLVAPGTYTGDGNRDIDFKGKGIVVTAEGGPDSTVIDCQGTMQYPHRGFRFHNAEDSLSVLSGFTITNGYAPTDLSVPFNVKGAGGGIICDSASSPLISNCILKQNTAYNAGGGLSVVHGSSPILIECSFVSNTVLTVGSYLFDGGGGGIHCWDSKARFIRCTSQNNISRIGAGCACQASQCRFSDCVFLKNAALDVLPIEGFAPGRGGAFRVTGGSEIEIERTVLASNVATFGWKYYSSILTDAGQGGGISCEASTMRLTNCTLSDNTAERLTEAWGVEKPGRGGGIASVSSTVQITNSIIAFSPDGESLMAVDSTGSTIVVEFSDFYANTGGDWVGAVAGQYGINGNISADPLFCDTATDNFSLHYESPCLFRSSVPPRVMGALPIGCCLCQKVGNVDCDSSNIVDITDLTVLIDNLFISVSSSCCDVQADIDGIPGIDISDITALIDNLYISFHALRDCY